MNTHKRQILNNFKDNLKVLPFNKFQIDDWVNLISDVMASKYITTPYNLDPKYLYRARPNIGCDDKPIDFFNFTSDLWAPPIEKVKKLGRCNSAGQRILYCSNSCLTSIFEIQPEAGQELTLIEYRSTGIIGLFGILGVEHLKDVNEEHNRVFSKHFNHLNKDSILLDNLLSEIFTTKSVNSLDFPIYNLTNAIANIFLINEKRQLHDQSIIAPTFKGLVYPSVATASNLGINFAMYPDMVKEFLIPTKAYKYKVLQKYDANHMSVIITHQTSSILADGVLNWVVKTESDAEYITDIRNNEP
jgi:hypothetical protein